MFSFKNSRRDFLHKGCSLTLLGGSGLMAASQSNAGESAEQPRPGKPQLDYRPQSGSLGGTFPFFWKGQYHVFHDGSRDWHHIVSEDLLHWRELPVAISRGAPGEPDSRQCGAGSILEANGTFHIFYLGRRVEGQRVVGTVCHATSNDLIHWKKNPKNPLLTPDYENYAGVTKDPFVFWNEQDGRYWMLIADRLRNAPTSRKGVLALAVSPDLVHWERREEPFFAPDDSTCEFEVADLFEWNRKYYLTYTTYMENTATQYRVADQVTGPWLAPAIDTFDDNLYYAGKTVSDGKRRLAFAFARGAGGNENVPTEQRQQAMIIREVTQQPDGSLGFRYPDELLGAWGRPVPAKLENKLGEWSHQGDRAQGGRLDGLAYAVTEDVPADCLLDMSVTLKPDTRCAGVFFRTTGDLERGYMLRLEPLHSRIAFEYWPKSWPWNPEYWRNIVVTRGQHPFFVQRTVPAGRLAWDRPIRIRLVIHGSIAQVFVNEEIALLTRVYHHVDGRIGLFVEYGEAQFNRMTIKSLA